MKMNGANGAAAAGGITKADLEKLIEETPKSSGPVQTIKVEQAPLKITTDDTYKM